MQPSREPDRTIGPTGPIGQTAAYAEQMRETLTGHRLSVWDALHLLTDFRDQSVGRDSTPPIHHAFQTAETLRCAGAADWLVVVGLVHDLGCVLARLRPGPGTSDDEQWGLTGPTRVLCVGTDGLDSCIVSYGHGEYMYRVLERTPGVRIPEVGRRLIRYHELEGWVDGRLDWLESDQDREAREVARRFAAADNHARPQVAVSPETADRIKHRYAALVADWLPAELVW